jgi:hypothetical protein
MSYWSQSFYAIQACMDDLKSKQKIIDYFGLGLGFAIFYEPNMLTNCNRTELMNNDTITVCSNMSQLHLKIVPS